MKCENCGKEHDGTFGSGRFCSRSCANSRKHSKETKIKICKSIKSNFSEQHIKIFYCKFCGKEITTTSKSWCSRECRVKFYRTQSLIKYFTFNKECLKSELAFEEWDRVRNLLYDLYWNQQKSSSDICKIFNYPNTINLMGKIFVYLDIPKRTLSEAAHNYYKNSNKPTAIIHNQYKSGWHTAWDFKKVFLRSSHELEFAKQLDKNKVCYEVEHLRIEYYDTQKQKSRISIPDFYIPADNQIIEIKSNYTLDKINMIDRAEEYIKQGYEFQLVLDGKILNIDELKKL